MMLQEICNGLLDLLYPPKCIICSTAQAEPICAQCLRKIHPVIPPFCDRCGQPVSPDKQLCETCESGIEPAFDWAQSMGDFTASLRKAVHHLKYNGKTALAVPLGKLLARSLDSPTSPLLTLTFPDQSNPVDTVVPVPLHRTRYKRRGYNQAELIARVVATERGWKLDTYGLVRIRNTHSQTTLHIAERASNVAGAFAVRVPQHFLGKRVLIIDDVLTTRATVRECARVVRAAGADRVCIAAIAQGL